MTDRSRSADITLAIDASIEDAWKALTDARELTRWFPLRAHVEAGAGGEVAWRWNDEFSMLARIDGWEPPRRLRLVQDREPPHGADGRPIADGQPVRMVMEFTLETRNGRTELRLVHSGFGSGAAWDDELEGVRHGWSFELRQLAHYLQRHRGRDRHVSWNWITTPVSQNEVWRVLTGPGGFVIPDPMRQAGRSFSLSTPAGSTLTGLSLLHIPGHEWSGVVRELDDGLARLWTWPGGGRTGVAIAFSTWNADHATHVDELGRQAAGLLEQTFASAGRAR